MAAVLIGYSCCPLTKAAFDRHGHEVWTCDELPRRGADQTNHLQCDVWQALSSRKWDCVILHPMCTYLTTSGAWAFADPDYEKYPVKGYHQQPNPEKLYGAARRQARYEALCNFNNLLHLGIPYIAIENPAVSFINTAIERPTQIIHPYQFGDDASKATGLWLRGLPRLAHTRYVEPRLVCPSKHHSKYGMHKCQVCGSQDLKPRWANQTDSGQNNLPPSDNRWLDRSETYPGIAAAFGDQWGHFLNLVVNS